VSNAFDTLTQTASRLIMMHGKVKARQGGFGGYHEENLWLGG
jgi:hypothetical protein